jgi:hypothetical protein
MESVRGLAAQPVVASTLMIIIAFAEACFTPSNRKRVNTQSVKLLQHF